MRGSITFVRLFAMTAVLSAAGWLAGCAATGSGSGQPAEKWHNFENLQLTQAEQDKASVVVLRERGAINGPAVNVFVNGEYLTSLLPTGVKQSFACVGNNRMTVQFTDVSTRYLEKERAGQFFELPAGQISYFAVVAGSNGAPSLKPLHADEARQLLTSQQWQSHTLPRVDNLTSCKPVSKRFTLQASALFAFDRSDYANLLPQGKQEIQQVAQEIAKGKASVQRITVTGYTDPEGSDAYNQQLSLARAQTVRRVLAESGVSSAIDAQGKGKTDLLVTDCRARFPANKAARDACNQPNRRVVIDLVGLQAGR